MNEGIIERIDQKLREEEAVAEKDAAGIITPEGVDSKGLAWAYRDCLRIVKEETAKLNHL